MGGILIMLRLKRYKKIFEKKILPFYEELYRFLLTLGCDSITAEDIIQEVMEKAWNQIDKLSQIDYHKNWLFAVTKNQYYSYMRLAFHQYEYTSEDFLLSDTECNQIEKDIVEILILQESSNAIEDALHKLPEKYSSIIRMRYFAELSYQEISEKLAIKPSTARSILSRGLKKLKILLTNTN